MEKPDSSSSVNTSHIILSLYVAICSILILIILFAPFQGGGNVLQGGEIYLMNSVSVPNGQ